MIIILCILIAIALTELFVIVALSNNYKRLVEQKDCYTPINFDN